MIGVTREQFITQAISQLLATTAPNWYDKEFEDPKVVNEKIISTAADLWERYKECLGDCAGIVAAPNAVPMPRVPFSPQR